MARKVGILFYGFYDAGYRCFQRIVGYRFAEDLFISKRREINPGLLIRKHYMVWFIQRSCGRTGKPFILNDLEIILVGKGYMVLSLKLHRFLVFAADSYIWFLCFLWCFVIDSGNIVFFFCCFLVCVVL